MGGGYSKLDVVRLEEWEWRWEAPDHTQAVFPQNWDETQQNHTVTCLMFKTTDNGRLTIKPFAMMNFLGFDLAFAYQLALSTKTGGTVLI
ncbi:hypothetical protein TNCV_3565511 [Trichonephila clavipes]|nr:hypothetical protein TNCV_3565511 [Trichonephila clavipes]